MEEAEERRKERYVTVMSHYKETANSVVQLSVASLILPTAFIRDILGVDRNESMISYLNWLLILSWILLLLAAAAGLYYQVGASRGIENKLWKKNGRPLFLVPAFDLTILSFYLGILSFLGGILLSWKFA